MKRIHFLVIAFAILMTFASPQANLSQARSLPGLLLANPSSASAKTLRLSAALGGKIVWSSSNRPNNRFELYSINPDSLAITPITDNTLSEGEPAWSPDGWKIAFDAYVSDNHELFVINADGSGQKQITLGYSCSSPNGRPMGQRYPLPIMKAGTIECM